MNRNMNTFGCVYTVENYKTVKMNSRYENTHELMWRSVEFKKENHKTCEIKFIEQFKNKTNAFLSTYLLKLQKKRINKYKTQLVVISWMKRRRRRCDKVDIYRASNTWGLFLIFKQGNMYMEVYVCIISHFHILWHKHGLNTVARQMAARM